MSYFIAFNNGSCGVILTNFKSAIIGAPFFFPSPFWFVWCTIMPNNKLLKVSSCV